MLELIIVGVCCAMVGAACGFFTCALCRSSATREKAQGKAFEEWQESKEGEPWPPVKKEDRFFGQK